MEGIPVRYFLYAEDDPDDQLFFQHIVERLDLGYSVIICDNGMELLKFLESLAPGDYFPCCIVLDINMPVMDGISTLHKIKEHTLFQELPIMLFSTTMSSENAVLCQQLAVDYLTKPVSQLEMDDKMRHIAAYCTFKPRQK